MQSVPDGVGVLFHNSGALPVRAFDGGTHIIADC
jgi:hypothetical protein